MGGGAATKVASKSDILSSHSGVIRFENSNIIKDRNGSNINISKNCESIVTHNGVEKFKSKVPYGAKVFYKDGAQIKLGDRIAEWDPFVSPIITEVSGCANLIDKRKKIEKRNKKINKRKKKKKQKKEKKKKKKKKKKS